MHHKTVMAKYGTIHQTGMAPGKTTKQVLVNDGFGYCEILRLLTLWGMGKIF